MQSNYKPLGNYIREVNVRNTVLKVDKLMGVSIQKELMPSIANTIGTNMRTYKILKKNQFAYGPVTSRNGDKISIALLEDYDEVIISQAYTSFEIINIDKLLPEYLMMWFRRPEFDRYARFMSHGSAREVFGWEELCNTKLPVPSIETQRAIVAEYNTVKNRIALNNQLIQKLEEAAQAIYKQWFEDFEFPFDFAQGKPDKNGKPYKSSGGKMVFNEEQEREIPEGWKSGSISDLVDVIDGDRGHNYPSVEEMLNDGYCLFLNAGNVTKIGFDFSETKFITKEKDSILRKGRLQRNDVVLTSRGTVGNVGFYGEKIQYTHIRINSGMVIFRPKDTEETSIFIYSLLRSIETKKSIENYLSGSAQPQLPIRDLIKIPIIIPKIEKLGLFYKYAIKLQNQIDKGKLQNFKLKNLSDLLLSKLAT